MPVWIKNKAYKIYKFDAESILNYYRGIFTNAALERITGINQIQIQHYASGAKRPRPQQLKKIETAFHELGRNLYPSKCNPPNDNSKVDSFSKNEPIYVA